MAVLNGAAFFIPTTPDYGAMLTRGYPIGRWSTGSIVGSFEAPRRGWGIGMVKPGVASFIISFNWSKSNLKLWISFRGGGNYHSVRMTAIGQ